MLVNVLSTNGKQIMINDMLVHHGLQWLVAAPYERQRSIVAFPEAITEVSN